MGEAKTTAGGEWQIWECLDTPVTSVTLQRLQKGQEYQFRVIAINRAGRSEPSVASRPKMAKEADLLPYIDAKTLRDVKMDAKDSGGLPLEYLIEKFCVASDAWSKQAVTSSTNF